MTDVSAPVATETATTNGFAEPQLQTPANDFKVPEAYASKPWVEKIKSQDDVWKTLDNAQSLIGKKTQIVPGEGATEEDWNNFYKTIGRPEDAKGYQFKPIEGLPEGTDLAPIQEKASTIFHKAGLTPKQAETVWDMYIKDELDTVSKTTADGKEKEAALDKEFDEVVKNQFGDKYDTASKNAQDMINQYVPESLRSAYGDLADKPKALAAVIKALDAAHGEIDRVKKEYGKEGKLTSGDQSTGESATEVLQELTNLRIEAGKVGAGTKYNEMLDKIKVLETKYRGMIK